METMLARGASILLARYLLLAVLYSAQTTFRHMQFGVAGGKAVINSHRLIALPLPDKWSGVKREDLFKHHSDELWAMVTVGSPENPRPAEMVWTVNV